MQLYISWSNDQIPKKLTGMAMREDTEGLNNASQSMETAKNTWKAWLEAVGGRITIIDSMGGRATLPANHLHELIERVEAYQQVISTPMSVGVGSSLADAEIACRTAEGRGGGRVLIYSPSMKNELKELDKSEPSPSPTFESALHEYAQKQDMVDAEQTERVIQESNQLKQKIAQVLQAMRMKAPELEQLREKSPEVYQILIGLTQNVIDMARSLSPEVNKPDLAKSEDLSKMALADNKTGQVVVPKKFEEQYPHLSELANDGSPSANIQHFQLPDNHTAEVKIHDESTSHVATALVRHRVKGNVFTQKYFKDSKGNIMDSDNTTSSPLHTAVHGIVESLTGMKTEDLNRASYNYSHLLPDKSYTLLLNHQSNSFSKLSPIKIQAHILRNGEHVGFCAGFLTNGSLHIGHSKLNPNHRGQGLGKALYEALMTHAFHNGYKNVEGDVHSSMASSVHKRLAEQHGMNYKPKVNPNGESVPGPYDERFGPYSYALKSEPLAKMALADNTPGKPIEPKPLPDSSDGGKNYQLPTGHTVSIAPKSSGSKFVNALVHAPGQSPTDHEYNTTLKDKNIYPLKHIAYSGESSSMEMGRDAHMSNMGNVVSAMVDDLVSKHTGIPLLEQSHAYDYSHLLPPNGKEYKMIVNHTGKKVTAHILHNGNYVGFCEGGMANVEMGPYPHYKKRALTIDYARIDAKHRQKGLGSAMYEALMTHAYHNGYKRVIGSTHSSLASATHAALARKHGMKYRPQKYPGADEVPTGPYDNKFQPYNYTLKDELEPTAKSEPLTKMALANNQVGKLITPTLTGTANGGKQYSLPYGYSAHVTGDLNHKHITVSHPNSTSYTDSFANGHRFASTLDNEENDDTVDAPVGALDPLVSQLAGKDNKSYDYSHMASPGYNLVVHESSVPGWINRKEVEANVIKDGKHIGFCNGLINNGILKIAHSEVHPEHRKMGLGSAMYESLMTHAFHSGVKVLSGDKAVDKPEGPYDEKFGGYGYTLKDELSPNAKDPELIKKLKAAYASHLEKAGLPMPHAPKKPRIKLPVGTVIESSGRFKVLTPTGERWKEGRTGLIMSKQPETAAADYGHPTSSLRPSD